RVDRHRRPGERHAEGGDNGGGPIDRRGDGGCIVGVASRNLEPPMLHREGTGVPRERDHVVVLVEGQPGEEPPRGAVRPEHCQLHDTFLSMWRPDTTPKRVHREGRRHRPDCYIGGEGSSPPSNPSRVQTGGGSTPAPTS